MADHEHPPNVAAFPLRSFHFVPSDRTMSALDTICNGGPAHRCAPRRPNSVIAALALRRRGPLSLDLRLLLRGLFAQIRQHPMLGCQYKKCGSSFGVAS